MIDTLVPAGDLSSTNSAKKRDWPQTIRKKKILPFTRLFYVLICKQSKPWKTKATQNELIQNASSQWKKKIFLIRSLFFFKQQTTQTPNSKSNPNQAFQNAITTLLLLPHCFFPAQTSSNIQLFDQVLHYLTLKNS